MRQTIFLLPVVALIAIALVACGGETRGVNIIVTMSEFKFEPMNLTIDAGQTVNLTLKNTGSIEHAWAVVGTNIKLNVGAGKTQTKTFVAPAVGTYNIDCDIAGHKEAGMVGQLIVK